MTSGVLLVADALQSDAVAEPTWLGPDRRLHSALDDDRDPACPFPVQAPAPRPRIFSGIQPTGVPHIGNDLGAIRNYVKLQWEYEAIYCIVDYHALTSLHDREVLRRQTMEMAAGLLALGLDPDRCALFVQSHRPECTELAWLLTTVTPVSWLERTPTYKEKREYQPEDVNHGLLTYPVLQAADIVLYKASLVPVGKDQLAHLELSREIVRAFNNRYGVTFPEPQPVFTESPIILGTDGVRKMSKSLKNTIDIFAPEDVIRKQIMAWSPTPSASCAPIRAGPKSATSASCTGRSATTTRRSGTASEPRGPAASTPRSCSRSGSSPTTQKARERYRELMADPARIARILEDGAERIRPLATATMDEVRTRWACGRST